MKGYRIAQNGEERGPYTLEQLRAMWLSGKITADAFYWQDGMPAWDSINKLAPDLETDQSRQVSTKRHGSGVVAIGSVICIVGVIMLFAADGIPGVLLLIIGFFIAVVGRMMS